MNKGKPIEPGCLAMIISAKKCPENKGRVVRVLHRMAPYEPLPGSTIKKKTPWPPTTWLLEALPGHPDLVRSVVDTYSRQLTKKIPSRHVGKLTRQLIRLDDDEAPKEVVRTVVKSKPVDEVI
jgi:hypothetical protein